MKSLFKSGTKGTFSVIWFGYWSISVIQLSGFDGIIRVVNFLEANMLVVIANNWIAGIAGMIDPGVRICRVIGCKRY